MEVKKEAEDVTDCLHDDQPTASEFGSSNMQHFCIYYIFYKFLKVVTFPWPCPFQGRLVV